MVGKLAGGFAQKTLILGLVLSPGTPASAAASGAARGAAPGRETSLGLVVLSTGTWVAYGSLDGFLPMLYAGRLERYEFNKILALGFYGKLLGIPAFAGIPLCWTAKRQAGEDEHRIAPGDAEFYLGRAFRKGEARLGFLIPAGYDRRLGDPWIGPGNVQVTMGAAVNPNLTRYSRRWEASGEAKLAYALDDGVAKAGSWGLFPGAKTSFRPMKEWKSGLETAGFLKSQYWGRPASLAQVLLGRKASAAQWSAGAAATLFLERYMSAGTALGIKAGHSLWGYRDAASFNATLYLLYFP